MSVALANSDEITLRKFLVYSAFLHGALALAIGVAAYYQYRGNAWGGVGGSEGNDVKVTLVSSAGIPMPKPEVVTENPVVDPTKGLYKEEPKPPDIPEPPKEELKIPEFKDAHPPKPPSHPSKVFVDKRPTPTNAIPYGKGGNPNLPTGYNSTPGAPSSGVAMQGQGGGDFTTRYGWYIEAVKRRINTNWDQFTIDAQVRAERRAHTTLTFAIYRDGSVKNVRMEQSSGNLSMDNSAQRALLGSVPMPQLPSDYSGSYVTVIFDFDLSMTR
jgi:TonB family protein